MPKKQEKVKKLLYRIGQLSRRRARMYDRLTDRIDQARAELATLAKDSEEAR